MAQNVGVKGIRELMRINKRGALFLASAGDLRGVGRGSYKTNCNNSLNVS